MKRRAFLLRGALFTGGLGLAVLPAAWLAGCNRTAPAAADLPDAVWRTLAAVQSHLFPSEPGAPGAAEIDALGYVKSMLAVPGVDPAERSAIIVGAQTVEQQAQAHAGKAFGELAEAQREAVLRGFEASDAGRRWLAGMMNYLIEALLADPVYGGNPDGIGWRWLDHFPGFPRPPADKRYFLLQRP